MSGGGFPRSTVLADGVDIPTLGLGLYTITGADVERVVHHALEVGYRHFDTAEFYGNEAEVGRALASSGVPRAELFVTSKVWESHHGFQPTIDACHRTLDALGFEHLDLYLIHWPAPAHDRYCETWEALEQLKRDRSARSIGVANFTEEHLDRIVALGGSTPSINQVELHSCFHQRALRQYHRALGIQTVSWSPLGQARYSLHDLEPLATIASAHGCSPHQVVLKWHLQEGLVVIPRSRNRNRLAENFASLDGPHLDASEMEAIRALDAGRRLGIHPDDHN